MMPAVGRVTLAVFKREFFGYFSNPTGYVFITLFVFLSAVAAFWQEAFFLNNLANLEQLNKWFPYLVVFLAPAIAMGLWAEERKQGTEELLLTLPARDGELLLGKYLAALGIYTVALLLSLSHLVVLHWLGSPDTGLMLATYLGYWLIGVALLPLALVASQLTDNLTVAFILGAVLCAIPVLAQQGGTILRGDTARLAERLSVGAHFRDLSAGVVTFSSIVYFLALAGAILYLSVMLTGRRRRVPGLGRHHLIRAVALVVIACAVTLLAAPVGGRLDVTSEQIHSVSTDTRNLINSLDPAKPVLIQAYLSPAVPRSYMEARANLINFLREFDELGKEKIESRVVETIKYSPAAREARERYGIQPFRVPVTEESASASNEIFLGLVFTCGSEEFVIPFFDRGLPVEYELMRSIRVVSRAKRRKVGLLETGAKLFGGLDFQTKAQGQEWSIVAELRKQYEVASVPADADYPADVDVLIAALPSTLTQPQVDRLTAYVKRGKPALVMLDPLPAFNIALSPQPAPEAAAAQQADLKGLLVALGIQWTADRVAWDTYNPHPQLRNIPPEVVFVSKGSQAPMPFQTKEEMTSGLQEVVLIYPGSLKARDDGKTAFVPLLSTGKNSGQLQWGQLVQRTIFGTAMVQGLPHEPGGENYTLAARVSRKSPDDSVNAVVVADADMMGEQFFELRRRGVETLNFDNVTFLLNAVDELAGDRSFIALRKRRPKHRTLEAVEARTRIYEDKQAEETRQAQANAERQLQQAQARLDAAVRQVQQRPDLDEQARQIAIANLQTAENRRLQVARTNIEDERQRQIEAARANMESSIRGIQSTIKLMAVTLPPIPAFVLFVIVSLSKMRRERASISPDRLIQRRVA